LQAVKGIAGNSFNAEKQTTALYSDHHEMDIKHDKGMLSETNSVSDRH